MIRFPTYAAACTHYGYATPDEYQAWVDGGGRITDDNVPKLPESVSCRDNEAVAWTFVLTARSRGWTVSDPTHNGFGGIHVTIWQKGNGDVNAPGRFKP